MKIGIWHHGLHMEERVSERIPARGQHFGQTVSVRPAHSLPSRPNSEIQDFRKDRMTEKGSQVPDHEKARPIFYESVSSADWATMTPPPPPPGGGSRNPCSCIHTHAAMRYVHVNHARHVLKGRHTRNDLHVHAWKRCNLTR